MSEKRFTYDKPLVAFSKGGINDNVTGETYEFTMNTVLDLLNEQQADLNYLARFIGEFKVEEFKMKLRNLRMLEDKLQISEASLALLIDMILFGDVDELVKRARECAEQFDKFTKEELEEMITGGVSNE